MTQEWTVPAWAVLAVVAGVAVLTVVLLAAVVRLRGAVRREAAAGRAATADLQAQVAGMHRATPPAATEDEPRPVEAEFVITHLGQDRAAPASVPAVRAPLFADLVLRETVVQAAALAHGVRRALSAETRNRIRFEMGRELKRSRRQRRADVKAALRAYHARERAVGDTSTGPAAAPEGSAA